MSFLESMRQALLLMTLGQNPMMWKYFDRDQIREIYEGKKSA